MPIGLIESLILPTGYVDVWDDHVDVLVPQPNDEGFLPLVAFPNHREEDYARAAALGYGADVYDMTVDHEIGHLMLAALMLQPTSPVLLAVAQENPLSPEEAEPEEAAVLALQRYAKSRGTSLLELARQLPFGDPPDPTQK